MIRFSFSVVKRVLFFVLLYIVVDFSLLTVQAGEKETVTGSYRIDYYIENLYKRIDFKSVEKIPYDVFNNAVRGYLNLKVVGKISGSKEILTVCNFDAPSVIARFWVIDLKNARVLYNTFVAHGRGSGMECATQFSNNAGSFQSSIGLYATGEVYKGSHGLSLKLNGLDTGYNDAAFERGIVIHGADYVGAGHIAKYNMTGKSLGCFALPKNMVKPIIDLLKDGTCLYAYYPDNKYLHSSVWLNKRIGTPPPGGEFAWIES